MWWELQQNKAEFGDRQLLRRPTRRQIALPCDSGVLYEGVLADERLYSNGHWLLPADLFATKPVAYKGIEKRALSTSAREILLNAERDCHVLLTVTDERYAVVDRTKRKDSRHTAFRKLVRPSGVEVVIDDVYVRWLSTLETVTLLAGRTLLDPVLVCAGPLRGVVMPMRPPSKAS